MTNENRMQHINVIKSAETYGWHFLRSNSMQQFKLVGMHCRSRRPQSVVILHAVLTNVAKNSANFFVDVSWYFWLVQRTRFCEAGNACQGSSQKIVLGRYKFLGRYKTLIIIVK